MQRLCGVEKEPEFNGSKRSSYAYGVVLSVKASRGLFQCCRQFLFAAAIGVRSRRRLHNYNGPLPPQPLYQIHLRSFRSI